MDLLDRMLGHDAWTTHQLLLRCLGLSDEQLDREFDFGHRCVRATFVHVIRNMEVWSDLMMARPVTASQASPPGGQAVPELMMRLDGAAANLADVARGVAKRGGWDERWVDVLDNPKTEKSYGGAIAHVITHSMHHRAQLLYMLRQLGVEDLPEGDVMSWEKQLVK